MRNFVLSFLLFIAASSAFGITYTVTNTMDAGAGSLRQAITDANGSPGQDTILFDASINGSPIVLTANMITSNGDIVIIGNGRSNTIINANGFGGFLAFGSSMTVSDLTIQNATNGISGTPFGATGTITINNCDIDGTNTVINPGNKSLVMNGCSVINTGAGNAVGLIYYGVNNNNDIQNCYMQANTSAAIVINYSGGVAPSNINITNNTIWGNTSGQTGIFIDYRINYTLTINNNTIDGFLNTGITITEGSGTNASNIQLNNNIIYNPLAAFDFVLNGNGTGANPTQSQNIVGTTSSTYGSPVWFSTADPLMIVPPVNNGGTTNTIDLNPGSLAIDNANGLAPATDQRGYGRSGAADIGAFEFNGVMPPPCIPQSYLVTNTNDAGPGSLRQAVLDANANTPCQDTIRFDASINGMPVSLTSGLISITDNLVVLGNGTTNTEITTGYTSVIFQVIDAYTEVRDVKFTDFYSGIEVPMSAISDLVVDSCYFQSVLGSGFGIDFYGNNSTISNSIFEGMTSHHGISLKNPQGNALIFNSFFSNSNRGIYYEESSSSPDIYFHSNTISLCTIGIEINNSITTVSDHSIENNTIYNCQIGIGITVRQPCAIVLRNNTILNSTNVGLSISEQFSGNAQLIELYSNIIWGSVSVDFSLGTFFSMGIGNPSGHNRNIVGTTSSSYGPIPWFSTSDPLMDPAGLQNNGGPTMTVGLQPTSLAIDNADISAPLNDQRGFGRTGPADIGAFEFNGINPLSSFPEMDVFGNLTSIANGDNTPDISDFTNFDSIALCNGKINRIFGITNTGADTLFLNGSPVVQITGPNAADFSINPLPSDTILPGDTTYFTVGFAPSFVGLHTATITIPNNDSDENPYTFDISGVGETDTLPPVVFCQDTTIYLNSSGVFSIDSSYVDNGSLDSCGIATMTVFPNTFSCADLLLSPVRVTLIVTDINGNVDSCNAFVTVLDTLPPTPVCNNYTAYLDASGQAIVYPVNLEGGSSDNCAIAFSGLLNFTNVIHSVYTGDTPPNPAPGQSFTANQTGFITSVTVYGAADFLNLNLHLYNGSTGSGIPFALGTPIYSQSGVNVINSLGGAIPTVINLSAPVPVTNGNQYSFVFDGDPNISLGFDSGNSYGGGDMLLDYANNLASDLTFNVQIAQFQDSIIYNCSSPLSNNVGLVVIDGSGNPSSCTATVTVLDTIAPLANCQPFTAYLDGAGNVTITGNDIDNLSSDNCSIVSYTANPNTFNCSNIGPNTVWLYVSDAAGNIDSCFTTVTVADTISGFFTSCPGNIIVNADPDSCGNVVVYPMPTVSDNCPAFSMSQVDGSGYINGDLFPVGTTIQTYVVTDGVGNTDTCSFTITVVDNQLPQITGCPSNITVSNDPGDCGAIVTWVPPLVTDNCPGVIFSSSHTPGSLFPIGTTTVTYLATDPSGNQDSCQFTITVNDTENPVIACLNDTVVSNDPSTCGAVVNLSTTFTDNCPGGTVSFVPASGSTFPVGTTLVTATATDAAGNTDVCTFNVTVNDTEDPVITCPGDIVASNDPGNCGAVINYVTPECYTAPISLFQTVDNVSFDGAPLSESLFGEFQADDFFVPSFASFQVEQVMLQLWERPLGIANNLEIKFYADNSGSPGTLLSTQTVTPADWTTTPIGVGGAGYTISQFFINLPAPVILSGGPTGATYWLSYVSTNTFTDVGWEQTMIVNGNESFRSANQITWTPNSLYPAFIPHDFIFELRNLGGGSPSDNCNCDTVIQTAGLPSGTLFPVGTTTNTFVVYDAAGNTDTCSFNVTVTDNENPVANCQDTTIYLDATGNFTINTSFVENGSTDNCGITLSSVNPSTFGCGDIGSPVQVTYVVQDAAGNTDTCFSNVTVLDTIAPVVICQNTIVNLDVTGNATITPAMINNGSFDNCTIASLTVSPSSFTCADTGANTVTLVVTDFYGNADSCTAIVNVKDITPPVVLCQNLNAYLDSTGNVSITTSMIDNGSNDACGIDTMYLDVYDFNCSNVGNNNVTITVVDFSGNQSTCGAVVTVIDTIRPVAQCQDITVYLDATGFVSITPGQIDNGSSDSCGISSIFVSPNSFTCSEIGINPVTLTIIDVNGNVQFCSANVTVLDTISPSVTCPGNIVQSNDPGNCNAIVTYSLPVINDNCIGSTLTQISGLASGSIFPSGTTTNTFVVTDGSGNTDTCSFDVTVIDTEAPLAVCQPLTVYLDATGNVSITASQIDNGSTDNCGIDSIYVSPFVFNCTDLGANTVTLNVLDINGNLNTCNTLVTVLDSIRPVVTPPADVFVNTDAGLCTASGVNIGLPTVSDNCYIVGITNNAPAVYPEGVTVVTWTVVDQSGNTTIVTQNVTVTDVENPTVICQNISVILDGTGNASITATMVNNGSTDNCGIASYVVSQTNFNCNNVGANTVTLIVTDIHGNVDSCFATVTVIDNQLPTITAPTDVVVNNDPGQCYASGVGLGAPVANDNCSGFTITNNAPSVFPIGVTTVTWTVTDASGNSASANQTVTVLDNEFPVITGMPTGFNVNNTPGVCGAIVTWPAPIASDNCNLVNFYVDYNSGTTFPVGTTTVTYTAIDSAGNVTTSTFNVTVNDVENPVIFGMPLNITLNAANGLCSEVATWVQPVVMDNCAGVVLTSTHTSGSSFPVGITTVTYTATDASGNSVNSNFTITVIDTQNPTIVTTTDTLFVIPGTCFASETSITPAIANDNCGILTLTNNASSPIPVGVNTITWTATDVNGNVTTQTQTVVVIDNEAPILTPPADVFTNVNVAGCQATFVNLGIPSFGDNCGIATISNNAPGSYPLGVTTVTWTVVDIHGNITTATQQVTVDLAAPINLSVTALPNDTVCENTSVTLSGNGAATYVWDNGVVNGVSFIATNTTLFTMIGFDTFGCSDTTTFELVVNPLPNVSYAAIPDDTVCTNTMVTLNGTGASTYSWTGGITDGVAFLLSGQASYTVTGTDANGCTNTAVANLYVRPLDLSYNVFPNDTVCEGTEVTVQGTGGSGGYSWSSGVQDGVPFTPLFDYNLVMSATDTNGCTGSIALDITVIYNPVVNLGPDIVQTTGAVQLDAGNPGLSFLWNNFATDQIIYVNSTGTYYVEVTNEFGCVGSDTINVTINWAGIEEEGQLDAVLYPNPSNGIFTLSMDNMPHGRIEVRMMDDRGRMLYTGQLTNNNQTFDFSHLAAATYYLQVITEKGQFVKPIIIKHNY